MTLAEIKEILPSPLRLFLGKTRAAGRRARIWWKVCRELSGVSAHDKAVLRRSIISAPVDIFRGLDRWRDPVVSENCRIRANGIGIFSVRAHTDDLYHTLPSREISIIDLIQSRLRANDVFVDAGANIGIYSVLASRLVGEYGRVISFEMMPETASILRTHLSENQCHNATVVEGALSEAPGQTVIAYAEGGKHGQSSILRKVGCVEVSVETKTLKEELKDIPAIQLMKMDLEGAELAALKGMGRDLQKVRSIIFENRDAEDVVEYVTAQGFKVTRLDGNNALAQKEITD